MVRRQSQRDSKTTSRRRRLVLDIPLECTHKGTRKIQSQPGRLGAGLKGLEQLFRISDTGSSIDEPNNYGAHIGRGSHGELFLTLALHCPLAVLHNVQERLQKRLTVSPDPWKSVRDLPADRHLDFVERRLDHDSKLFKNRTQVYVFGHSLLARA